MTKWILAAGAAALAITSPALAQHGGGHGGGKGGGQAASPDRGGGGGGRAAKANRSGGDRAARADRGGGGNRAASVDRGGGGSRAFRADRGGRSQSARVDRGGNRHVNADRGGDRARNQAVRFSQGKDRARNNARIETRRGNQARAARFVDDNRGNGRGRDVIRTNGNARFANISGDKVFRVRDVDRGVVRVRDVDRDDLFVRRLGYGVGGCPPGLASKGCMPPGQAAKFIGQPLVAATGFGVLDPLPRSFRSLYWDDDDYYYRYGGGYLYRVDRDDDLIAGLVPLFGAALIGQPFQPYYASSFVPPYYNAFYPNSRYDCHRYGYGYVYETDCLTGMVENVIPTYDYGYGVGQLMPASYSYYNLPYTYRSYYTDNNDYYYRYAPGAIYRVDRDTALISAVVSLLAGGLTVGQPLPVGYSAYNVPLAYRSSYFDSPDVWYRYNDGYIYAVDPGTRVVRSVAYTIV